MAAQQFSHVNIALAYEALYAETKWQTFPSVHDVEHLLAKHQITEREETIQTVGAALNAALAADPVKNSFGAQRRLSTIPDIVRERVLAVVTRMARRNVPADKNRFYVVRKKVASKQVDWEGRLRDLRARQELDNFIPGIGDIKMVKEIGRTTLAKKSGKKRPGGFFEEFQRDATVRTLARDILTRWRQTQQHGAFQNPQEFTPRAPLRPPRRGPRRS